MVATLSLALLAQPALARSCAGVTLPDSVVVDGKTLVLNGLGLREATIFNVDVFVAALYVEQKSKSAKALLSTEQRVQVVLHFVRETSAETIADELDAGLTANAPTASPKDKRTLRGWTADAGVGDSMVFTYVPGKGLEVSVKGRVAGTFSGTAFARAVLSVLIGPHPPNEGLRAGLLGGRCG
jgi:hypothetical protein